MTADRIKVEVAYARPEAQVIIETEAEAGATVRKVIEVSGILTRFPELDLESFRVGIFGRLTDLDTGLENGDRIEIYRPLIADPKDSRRLRALKK